MKKEAELTMKKDLMGRPVLAEESKEAIEEKEAVVEKGWKGTAKAMKKHKEIDNPFALTNWMSKQKKGDPWGSGGKLKDKPESHYTEKGKKKKSSFDDEKIISEIVNNSK